eukprot:g1743.t1
MDEDIKARFVDPAKRLNGKAAVDHIQKLLGHPKVLVFGEFLAMPNIQKLRETEDHPAFDLLQIFAHGTYAEYERNKNSLPPLTPPQTKKLRQLTVVSLAQASKILSYTQLQSELGIESVRELEDLIIDAFYSGLIRGKLDQRAAQLEVQDAQGRDTQHAELEDMVAKLERWEVGAAELLGALDAKINAVQAAHVASKEHAAAHEAKVQAAVDALKVTDAGTDGGVAGEAFDDDPSAHSTRGKHRQRLR